MAAVVDAVPGLRALALTVVAALILGDARVAAFSSTRQALALVSATDAAGTALGLRLASPSLAGAANVDAPLPLLGRGVGVLNRNTAER